MRRHAALPSKTAIDAYDAPFPAPPPPHCMQLGADKLFNMHMDEVTKLRLPPWLPLSDAQEMLIKTLQVCACALRPSSPPIC